MPDTVEIFVVISLLLNQCDCAKARTILSRASRYLVRGTLHQPGWSTKDFDQTESAFRRALDSEF